MSTMTADALGSVSASVLADGIVVRLSGSLDVAALPALRSDGALPITASPLHIACDRSRV